jgi:hypothetical protein
VVPAAVAVVEEVVVVEVVVPASAVDVEVTVEAMELHFHLEEGKSQHHPV